MIETVETRTDDYTIYVHDGRAHIDELLAVTLYVIAQKNAPLRIERLPSADAVARAGDASSDEVFIDCGGHFDPSTSRFDHHQDPALPSAAKLVFDHFFPEYTGSELAAWVDWISLVDTRGPKVFETEGVSKSFQRLSGVTQGIILKAFEKAPLQAVQIFEIGLMEVLEHETKVNLAKAWLKDRFQIVQHAGLTLLALTEPPPRELSRAVKGAHDELIETQDISVVYGYVLEEPGVRNLFRTDPGHTRVDFTKASPSDPVFVHNNGFLLKFRPKDDTEWLDLVAQSLIANIEANRRR